MKTLLLGRSSAVLRRFAMATTVAALAIAPASAAARTFGAPLGTNNAATPVLAWAPCDASLLELDPAFECATARVPLDYSRPTGTQIELAVSKLPATGAKIGSVFVNPGGPGAPGLDAPTFATPELRERFDIVGFDTRGTASSTPAVRCAATSEEAARLLNPTFPTSLLQEATALSKASQGAAGCGRRSATIASHMSTGNVARDLELLRKGVGDPSLNFLGFSSGSLIGETYVNLFPSTARAIALDGTLDPVRFTKGRTFAERYQPLDQRLKSYVGTDEAVTGFLKACAAAEGTCAFAAPGATAAQLRTKFDALIARLESKGGVTVDLGDGEETLTYQEVVGLIYGELNVGIFTSQDLASTIQAIDLASRGQRSIPSADLKGFLDALFRHRQGSDPIDPSEPYDNFQDAFSTFVCNDTAGPSLGSTYAAAGRTAEREVPGFGPFWIYTTAACASFPVEDDDHYDGPWNASTTNPVLVLGNAGGDPSVRYANAVAAQSTLGNAQLLSVNMYGHTAYNLASTCVNEAVDQYFIALASAPATCDTDFGPFDPIDEGLATEGAESGYGRGTHSR